MLAQAIKGDAHVVGFAEVRGEEQQLLGFAPVNLGVSQCPATIFSGRNYSNGVTIEDANNNPGIDNPELADSSLGDLNQDTVVDAQTRTSIQVIFLSDCDIDLEGARTRGLTHKLFTHVGYSWADEERATPYIGIGASAEFGNSKKCCPDDCVVPNNCCKCPQTTSCGDTCCPKCNMCSLSQWKVWFKGGVSF